MIRVKINRKRQSDVNEMKAKGWHVCVYREPDLNDEFVTAEKNGIRFVMKGVTTETEEHVIEIRKYVNGFYKDSKKFFDNGCGINGTLCISEGITIENTYAFFRNEKLQDLIEEFGLRRVVFPREEGSKFSKTVYDSYETGVESIHLGDVPVMPPFHTDGVYEQLPSIEPKTNKFEIHDATYVYEYNSLTLTIPWKYDVEYLRELMKSLTD